VTRRCQALLIATPGRPPRLAPTAALGAVLQITGIRPVVTNLTILTDQLSVGRYAVGQRRVLLGPIAGEHLTPGGVALTTITMVPASRTACGARRRASAATAPARPGGVLHR
jgi:hypothetical protein